MTDHLTTLEARRADLFDLCCRQGTYADWCEYNRATAALQAELIGDHLWPAQRLDVGDLHGWYDRQERDDPYADQSWDVPF